MQPAYIGGGGLNNGDNNGDNNDDNSENVYYDDDDNDDDVWSSNYDFYEDSFIPLPTEAWNTKKFQGFS